MNGAPGRRWLGEQQRVVTIATLVGVTTKVVCWKLTVPCLILAFTGPLGKNSSDNMNILRRRRQVPSGFAVIAAMFLFFGMSAWGIEPSVSAVALKGATVPAMPAGGADVGPLPSSQPVTFTLHIAQSADRAAALQQFLADVQTPGSAVYHRWLTPQQFGTQFGMTPAQVADVQAFAAANNFTVASVAASGLRVTLSGTVSSVEAAMAPGLHQVQAGGNVYFTNTAVPVMPESIAGDVAAVDGLSTLPDAYPLSVVSVAAGGSAAVLSDALAGFASLVDANAARVIAVSGSACLEDFSSASQTAVQMELRQAVAQGMTILAASGCGARGSAGFPSALSEVTAIALAPGTSPATTPTLTEARPAWQAAAGLPADGFRHEVDFTVSSVDALTQTLNQILLAQATATNLQPRLGNINATMYQLAPTKGLFTQPDDAAIGTWEAATGLGVVDLTMLGKIFPKPDVGADPAQVTVHVTGSGNHGQTVTVYAVLSDPSGQVGYPPSGNVTFSSSPAGIAGTVATSNGTSQTISTNALAAGTYTITATYYGDGTYAGATGTASYTVQGEASDLSASTPGNATFGSTFALTVTDRSDSGVGTPTGSITVTEYGSTNYMFTQPLTSTTPGVSTATFSIPAMQAGSVTLSINCASADTSFTCNSPISVPVTIAKANPTTSTITINPNPPVYGSQTAITVAIAGIGGAFPAPTGYVGVTDNSSNLSGCSLTNGTCTFNSSTISGTVANAFTASYQGDTNYNASTATATTTGTKIATTLVVNTPNKTAVVTGGQVNLSATLTLASAPSNLNPTGDGDFLCERRAAGVGGFVVLGNGAGDDDGDRSAELRDAADDRHRRDYGDLQRRYELHGEHVDQYGEHRGWAGDSDYAGGNFGDDADLRRKPGGDGDDCGNADKWVDAAFGELAVCHLWRFRIDGGDD